MASNQEQPTLADYFASAISPVLLMALVGSLVFFLVEILYEGQYTGQLLWTLFFFVFGAVLISRISMTQGISNRSSLYGMLLGGAVWLALQTFVKYPDEHPLLPWNWAIHLGWIILIWWCVHRLTWDCTFVDDSDETTGAGLLQAAGLFQTSASPAAAPATPEEPVWLIEDDEDTSTTSTKPERPPSWWQRYQRYREEKKKRHTPGIWVVYFSLAALPLFGLGQSLIPASAIDRRQYTFWLMVIYVGSGLGLLLTTCFLGLRRYLRQRKLQMPTAVAGIWLTLGGTLVAILLLLGALLPRPESEYGWPNSLHLGSTQREASRYAFRKDSPGKGKGRARAARSRQDRSGDANDNSSNRQGDGSSQQNSSGSASGDKEAGQKGNMGSSQQQDSSDAQKQDDNSSQSQKQDTSSSHSDSTNQDSSRQDRTGDSDAQQRDSSSDTNRNNKTSNPIQNDRDNTKKAPGNKMRQSESDSRSSSDVNRFLPDSSSGFFAQLADFLKWTVFVILGVLFAIVAARGFLGFLANFTLWAQNLLNLFQFWQRRLSQWAQPSSGSVDSLDPEDREQPLLPFASYHNPFRDGRADRMPSGALVRYSFAALQSWAGERGQARRPDETPLEFAERLGAEFPAMEIEAHRFTILYAQLLYARGPLPADYRQTVRPLWEHLEALAERPMSAYS